MFLWNIAVTSLAEVWIEIESGSKRSVISQSLPLRKCGLKFAAFGSLRRGEVVTSLAEVWIEIVSMNNASGKLAVTSLAEVWIEIANCAATSSAVIVTSLAEVWIEIMRTEVL